MKNKEILHKGIEAVRFQIRVTTYILENEGKSRAYEYARTKLMAYNQMLQILGMYGEDKHSLMRRIISNAVICADMSTSESVSPVSAWILSNA